MAREGNRSERRRKRVPGQSWRKGERVGVGWQEMERGRKRGGKANTKGGNVGVKNE